jgi:GNAT superfamily N-acetyltransferase
VTLDIRPLTPDRVDDLAGLFCQGGDPRWCWCAWYRLRSLDFRDASPEENRAVLEQAVRDPDTQSPGLLAYDQDEVIGWVSVGPRSEFERLRHSTVLAPVDDTPVWSIVCFVVGRRSRRKGVAGQLLAAAVDHARRRGASVLEAYPVETSGHRTTSAALYRGTLSMFERAGFEVVARRQANRSAPVRPVVRLVL